MVKKIRSRKRGRPKIDRPLRDKGTPESLIKRLALVGDGDITMSSTPIDVMYTRKIINPNQYNAGLTYWYLYTRVFGKPYPQSNTGKLLSPISSRSVESIIKRKDIEHHTLLDECLTFIKKEVGLRGYNLMRAVIVFQQYPNYLSYLKPKPRDNPKKMIIRDALDSIIKFFDTKKRKR